MLLDWKLFLYGIQYFIAASSVYSLAFFKPIILRQGMGFSYAKSQLLSSPPYVFAIVASLIMAYISDKIRMRWPIMCSQALIAIVGLLVILYTKPPGVRYFGLFLAIFGCQANIPGTLAYGNNQTGRMEKKGVVAAAMISFGAAGGVAGKYIRFLRLSITMLTLFREHNFPSPRCSIVPTGNVGHYRHAHTLYCNHALLVDPLQEAKQVGRRSSKRREGICSREDAGLQVRSIVLECREKSQQIHK